MSSIQKNTFRLHNKKNQLKKLKNPIKSITPNHNKWKNQWSHSRLIKISINDTIRK